MPQRRLLLSVAVVLLAGSLAPSRVAGRGIDQPVEYNDLAPLAGVVDIRGIWRKLNLPPLPPTFCHVGLLGWHCHDTTKQPWDPSSLLPKDKIPPMPANATCVICPQGWSGPRRNLVDVLIDLPLVQASGKLPDGMWDMAALSRGQVSAGN